MNRSPLNKLGRKGREWVNARRELKRRFEWAGITICEFRFKGCLYDASGSFAHCRKRRKLMDGEIWHVAVSCLNCHNLLDLKMTHEEMHAEVHKVIDRRGLLAPARVLVEK